MKFKLFIILLILNCVVCKVVKDELKKDEFTRIGDRYTWKYINLVFPINPHLRRLFKSGLNGGYKSYRHDYHRGKDIFLPFPLKEAS